MRGESSTRSRLLEILGDGGPAAIRLSGPPTLYTLRFVPMPAPDEPRVGPTKFINKTMQSRQLGESSVLDRTAAVDYSRRARNPRSTRSRRRDQAIGPAGSRSSAFLLPPHAQP